MKTLFASIANRMCNVNMQMLTYADCWMVITGGYAITAYCES